MKILLIDTCGEQGSVAIADAGCEPPCVVSATLPGRSASEKLIGAVRELMRQSHNPTQAELERGTRLGELDAIAIVNGPGSFTGVRVGMSAAKGLCEALCVPVVAISRLAVLASIAAAKSGTHVFAALDAGRGEFYLGEYADSVKLSEALVNADELRGRMIAVDDRLLAVCEENVARALAEFSPRVVKAPDAAAALPLALDRFRRGDFDDVAAVDANYLRRTDLEIAAKAKLHAVRTARGESA